jgi:hypothetical protein
MKLIDAQGRIFGKISILDLGAACIILLVLIGIFIVPGPSGSIAQVSGTKPITAELLVRGLSVKDSQALVSKMKEDGKTDIIIRNQPYGSVNIKDIEILSRTVTVSQPDGSVKALPDPRPEAIFSTDMIITIGGNATITPTGAVLGNSKVKIGTTVELDGPNYNFNSTIIDVRVD